MTTRRVTIPVIDLFAGPGGLSEGFSRYSEFFRDELAYSVKLSIEKEYAAVRTLRLRAFVRQFPEREIPSAYYDYVRADNEVDREVAVRKMQSLPEWRIASSEVWRKTLGEPGSEKFFKLHSRIRRRTAGADFWVLLGGPPCQAYSTVGRSRRLGDGRDLRLDLSEGELIQRRRKRTETFFQDERHTLYTEYLEIVALHQPPIFVMENVKGILTSKLPSNTPDGRGSEGGAFIFDQILRDMSDPWLAIRNEKLPAGWESVADGRKHGYNLYSFTTPPNEITGDNLPEDYLIRAEEHGVPQERHRVILLGVREDLDAVPIPLEGQRERISVERVIGGLPRLRSGRSGLGLDGSRSKRADSGALWAEAIRQSVSGAVLRQIQHIEVRRRLEHLRDNILPGLDRGGRFLRCAAASRPRDLNDLGRWLYDPKLGGVLQHETRDHMDADFGRYLFAAVYSEICGESPKLRHFPPLLLPHHENVRNSDGRPTGAKIFHDRFRVQVKKRPATTIMSHIRKDGHYYIHYDPTQCRSLTVREAARLQTFPDNYFFEGNRTNQYEQVGNAVPPFLAVQLARVVTGVLKQISVGSKNPISRSSRDLYTAA